MTLDDLWKLTRRYWILLTACTCIGLAGAAIYIWTRTPLYTASSQALVTGQGSGSSGDSYSATLVAQQKAKQWVAWVDSDQVASAVVKDLNLNMTSNELGASLTTIEPTNDGAPTFGVTAVADSPALAQQIANTVMAEVGKVTTQNDPNSGATMRVISPAALPTTPSSPVPSRILPIGALVGLLAGYVLAMIRHRQDTRIRSAEDVEENIGASVLGVLPANKALAEDDRSLGKDNLDFQTREALRQLRTNLRFVDVDHDPRSIVITSSRMGEGKSTVSSSLAWVLADSGEQVVLIDADLRRPAVAGIFHLDGTVGLTQVLAGTATLADALQTTDKPGLYILPAGQIPPNPSELLGSQRMHQLIEKLSETHRVILDAPPLLPVTDAALLSASADGAVVVVSASDTHHEHVRRAASNLNAVGARVLGAVLNRVNTSRFNRIVYGESQYGYGAYGTYYGTESYGDYKYEASASSGGSSARRDNASADSRADRRRER